MRDLASTMGISGPSLYNAFGDKQSLFAASLDRYCEMRTYPLLARIDAKHAGGAALAAFFAEIVDRSVADRERRGCFLINAAIEVAPHDRALRTSVRKHLDLLRAFFARHLAVARQDSRADGEIDSDAAAEHLLAVLLGIRVLARSRPERKLLERIADSALASLGLTSRAGRQPKRARRPTTTRRTVAWSVRKPVIR